MNFYNTLLQNDTITAIATAAGNGAIAIIRISGKKTFAIIEKIFSKDIKQEASHTVHYGHILGEDKEIIDSVLVLLMKSPNSYTGEDSVEINCHGGKIVTQAVLKRVIAAGARPAQPGEFTYRAFRNGKLDLTKAEAVQTLIAAENETAMAAAQSHLEGKLSKKIINFQKKLTDIAAIIEAWVDFPEEGLEFSTEDILIYSLEEVLQNMKNLSNTYEDGRKIQEGIKICITGTPNVGKSSLMNMLLGKERSIVTEIAGTTRDTIEEDAKIGSLHYHLIDTAGIHASHEIIEQEGIKRSQIAIQQADIVLLLLDASREISTDDHELIKLCPKNKTLYIWNKIDIKLEDNFLDKKTIEISVKEQKGIDALIEEVNKKAWYNTTFSKQQIYLTQKRHKQELDTAIMHCQKTIQGLREKISPEFLSIDMRSCLHALSSIIGTNVTEDILSSIFLQFCIGK